MNPETQKLIARIEALEAALKPFARAAEGFRNPDIEIEYQETDEQYYNIFSDIDNLIPLKVADLQNAATTLHWDY